MKFYHEDEELKAVLDWLSSDFFSPQDGWYCLIFPTVFAVGRSFLYSQITAPM